MAAKHQIAGGTTRSVTADVTSGGPEAFGDIADSYNRTFRPNPADVLQRILFRYQGRAKLNTFGKEGKWTCLVALDGSVIIDCGGATEAEAYEKAVFAAQGMVDAGLLPDPDRNWPK